MGRHTRDAGTVFTSLALLVGAANASITIGAPSSPISYINATGSSGTTLIPFSVNFNSIPANDWSNVSYLNNLRSSAWTWGVNVSESSDAQKASDSGTTQSVVSLTWPKGEGPEVVSSDWSYCALYIPEMGDSLLSSNGNCEDNDYGQCEKAVVTYLDAQNIITDPHFTCSGQRTLPVPAECKSAFGSNVPSQLTMYASNSMTSGSAFISRSDSSQSLRVGATRPFEVVLFELAKTGTDTFPAAIFINCVVATKTFDPILADGSSSSSPSASTTNSSSSSDSTSSSDSSSSSSSAENYLTASSGSPSATSTAGGGDSDSSSSGSSTAVTTKKPAGGGLGAANSYSEGILPKMAIVVGAYAALLVVGLV